MSSTNSGYRSRSNSLSRSRDSRSTSRDFRTCSASVATNEEYLGEGVAIAVMTADSESASFIVRKQDVEGKGIDQASKREWDEIVESLGIWGSPTVGASVDQHTSSSNSYQGMHLDNQAPGSITIVFKDLCIEVDGKVLVQDKIEKKSDFVNEYIFEAFKLSYKKKRKVYL